MPHVNHYAYCTGPVQLMFLLAALEQVQIETSDCMLMLDDDPASGLVRTMTALAGTLGFNFQVMPATIGSGAQSELTRALPLLLLQLPRLRRSERSFWFSRGVVASIPVVSRYLHAQSSRIVEFYDGFRTPIVTSVELGLGRYRGPEEGLRGSVKSAIWNTIMPSISQFLMPDGLGWESSVSEARLKHTVTVRPESLAGSLRRVGRGIEDFIEVQQHPPFDIMLLTGLSAERYPDVSLEAELALYRDILAVFSRSGHRARVLIKPHPRTRSVKLGRLRDLAAPENVTLHFSHQLAEHIVGMHQQREVAIIGEPSTALLLARLLRGDRAYCLGLNLISGYLGSGYSQAPYKVDDHSFMNSQGIPEITALADLVNM